MYILLLSFRSDPIPSTSMRSTVYPPRALSHLIRLPTLLTLTLLLPPHRQTMNPHLNVSSACPRRARSFFCLAAIWSPVGSAPSTWLNSALGVPLLTLKQSPPRLGRITRPMLGAQRPLHHKRKAQGVQLKLSSTKFRLPTEGRGGLRGGSALYADNVCFALLLFRPTPDMLSISLYFTPQDYNGSATKGRNRSQGR